MNLEFIKVFRNEKFSSVSINDFMQVIPLRFGMITASMLKNMSDE